MTTKHSPLRALKAQSDKIAAVMKAASRGEVVDPRFADKIREALKTDVFKTGIVMDDKVITIEMPLAMIRETSEAGLSEYLLKHMRETRDTIN